MSDTHNEQGEEYPDVKERRLYEEAKARLKAADQHELDPQDVALVLGVLEKAERVIDVQIMSKGYGFMIGSDMHLYALTSGDMGVEDTRLEVSMTEAGWMMGTPDTDPEELTAERWDSRWKRYFPGQMDAGVLKLVVTKLPNGVMDWDWLEYPAGDQNYRIAHFAQNFWNSNKGTPMFWMSKEDFETHAPQWAKDALEPLSEEALTEFNRRSQAAPRDAEELSERQKEWMRKWK